jgi:hypothetical protein
MKLADRLIKKINAKYQPATMVSIKFGQNDIILRTDKEGNAIQMFIGKMNSEGLIKGDRYSRTIIKGREGELVKDYWERKGKAG